MQPKALIIISKCLIGERCRYNGEVLPSLLDLKQMQLLRSEFQFLPFCPEIASGLPVPRPPLHFVLPLPVKGRKQQPQLLAENDHKDYAPALILESERFLQKAGLELGSTTGRIAGAVLKEKSPSCGLCDCKIYQSSFHGPVIGKGAGLFTKVLEQEGGGVPCLTENKWEDFLAVFDFFYNIIVELAGEKLQKQEKELFKAISQSLPEQQEGQGKVSRKVRFSHLQHQEILQALLLKAGSRALHLKAEFSNFLHYLEKNKTKHLEVHWKKLKQLTPPLWQKSQYVKAWDATLLALN